MSPILWAVVVVVVGLSLVIALCLTVMVSLVLRTYRVQIRQWQRRIRVAVVATARREGLHE